MKKIFVMMILCAGVMSASAIPSAPKASNDTVIVLKVDPVMHCANCEKKIKSNIRFEKGVKNIETSLEKQTVTITADKRKINVENLRKAFAKIGYKVR